MFIAALFTIAKTWKQSKCPSTVDNGAVEDTMEYHSVIKENEIMPSAGTWMDLEIIILSEVSQRKTSSIRYHLYVEFLEVVQTNLFTKQKQTHRLRERTDSNRRVQGVDRGKR